MDGHVSEDVRQTRIHAIKRVLWIVLILNVVVALAKFGYGTITATMSMRADGIHSFFDGIGNIVGLVGMTMASRPADYEHPYGHAKFETIASVVIGLLLLVAAYNVGSSAIQEIISGENQPDVSMVSFIVMVVTLIINILVTTWERRSAKRLSSEILAADSQHTLSDVLVTIGVIVGLIFIWKGNILVDPIMSLLVACVILYTAFTVFKQANDTLSDRARISPTDIARVAECTDGVDTCHKVRTRGSEQEVYIDLHILVDPQMTVARAHKVAINVEDGLKGRYPQVVDVMVHVEPDTPAERAEGL